MLNGASVLTLAPAQWRGDVTSNWRVTIVERMQMRLGRKVRVPQYCLTFAPRVSWARVFT